MPRQEPLNFTPACGAAFLVQIRPVFAKDAQNFSEMSHRLPIWLKLPDRVSEVVMRRISQVHAQQLARLALLRGMRSHLGCCWPPIGEFHALRGSRF